MIMLQAQNIGFHRGQRCLLQNINLYVRAGELVALIGPNGAGKSTLLRILAGELTPDKGCCLINGRDIHQTAPHWLARQRAVLPQNSNTQFPLTARDLVQLGRVPWRHDVSPRQNRRAVHQALHAVGAETLCRRDYRQLSGGERQRIQLARVLAQIWETQYDGKPRYLLLDEPAASLDVGHQQRFLNIIRQQLRAGIGVLAVLHELNLAATFADRVYLLHENRIRAAGTPTDVITATHINQAYATPLDVRHDPHTKKPLVLPQRQPLNKSALGQRGEIPGIINSSSRTAAGRSGISSCTRAVNLVALRQRTEVPDQVRHDGFFAT